MGILNWFMTAQQKQEDKTKQHYRIINQALSQVETLKDAQNIQVRPLVDHGFLTVYMVTMTLKERPLSKTVIVYPQLTFDVMHWLIMSTFHNNILGITHVFPNAIVAKTYKI